ncbi:hypothetical protein [Marinobacter sp. HL-58]|uniref:hypothetical protein n=1 Tax=Marinobacter sp. HL-58 TaxID=1479237 RepID=UPI0006DA4754|nr:hypothetical protein [Marinobacter sp. HL-58]KPP97330.1 MAG: hypothetical protein HLUCCO03_01210 [Marinobacter sp. HL-58]
MNINTDVTEDVDTSEGMDLFGKYLSVWVALAIIAGAALESPPLHRRSRDRFPA